MNEPQANQVAGNARQLSRRRKLIGALILLASFASQNFLYDRWDLKTSQLRAAIDDRTLMDKSVLLDEILYFTAGLPGDPPAKTFEVKRLKINDAARKIAISSAMPVAFNQSLTADEKAQMRTHLFSQAAAVTDYDSFQQFIQSVNKEFKGYSGEMNLQYQRLGRMRVIARWCYLALYLAGSTFLLAGLWQDA